MYGAERMAMTQPNHNCRLAATAEAQVDYASPVGR